MEFKEYRAKTVNDAITDALIELETTSDMIEYEVVEEGSAGILGLFSKDAIVRVRRKEETEEEFNIREEIRSSIKLTPEKKPVKKPSEKQSEKKQEKKSEEKTGEKKAAVKTADKKPAEPKQAEAKSVEKKQKAAIEKEKADASTPVKEGRIITGKEAENESVNEILQVLFQKLGIQAAISTTIDEGERVVNIVVEGDDTGDLIGKRGQTLDAIQYLLSLVINKQQEAYYRVKLDTNNYRERRQKTLENLAKNVASKVKKTRKKVALEPMNPYERRIIHAYLQADKFVTTKSEGEEPNRRVVVYYKKS